MSKANHYCSRRGSESALTLAVRLAVRQVSEGIPLEEAIQFAARYHNVTCAAIQAELAKEPAVLTRFF